MSFEDNTTIEGRLFDGRYRIVRRIGAGGMARVFLAEDVDLHRDVAIKVLHERFAEDEQFIERFSREARAAAGLNHPNIVAVYDRGQTEGSYYIAMEYLDGDTLKDVITRQGPIPAKRAIDIALQLLAALRFAHRREVIHRDVKPQNVMVLRDGRVKVADFGIARAGDSDMTEAGSIVGTAQYLSPEQARGQHVGPESDLYSVGVVLYEMLTGRVPFNGDSAVAIAMKHVQEPPTPPSRIEPSIPPELEAIVMRALQKDAARRYHSADEMGLDLDRVRKGLGVSPATTAMAAGDAYADAGRTMVSAPPPPRPGNAAAAPRRTWPWIVVVALLASVAGLAAYVLLGLGDGGGSASTTEATTAAEQPVPEILGFPVDGATEILEKEGFEVVPVRRFSRRPKDTVIKVEPAEGTLAPPGSEVTITISDGIEQVEVPDVVGRQYDNVEPVLTAAGFKVTRRTRASDDVPAGEVLSQDPTGGTKADKGSEVILVVSKGKAQVTVPNVINQSEGDARSEIEGAGFDVAVDSAPSATIAVGLVIDQDPGPGDKAERGSTVTIVISSGPVQVAVPDVVGQTAADATTELEGLGFNVVTQTVVVADPGQVDIVQSIDPPAGTRADEGSDVTIVVGRL
jgi:eukaryotic-like serine/threonine-protein kinase